MAANSRPYAAPCTRMWRVILPRHSLSWAPLSIPNNNTTEGQAASRSLENKLTAAQSSKVALHSQPTNNTQDWVQTGRQRLRLETSHIHPGNQRCPSGLTVAGPSVYGRERNRMMRTCTRCAVNVERHLGHSPEALPSPGRPVEDARVFSGIRGS